MKLSSKVYQALLRVYRSLPFQRTVAHILRALPVNLDRYYRDLHFRGAFSVNTKRGSFRLMHLGTSIENELFWKGLENALEADTVWFWEEYCKISHTIFDIGSNTGVYSFLAKTENPVAEIYAFEPSRKIYEPLTKNNELNGGKVICEQIAISNSNKLQTFYDLDSLEFPTSGSLDSNKLKTLIQGRTDISEYEVPCMTFDKYIIERKIARIDLVKIDVELHEPAVFEGFKKTPRVQTNNYCGSVKSRSWRQNFQNF